MPTPPVAGYVAWYDAADLSTITSSGGLVSQWNDKGSGGHNLSASGTQRPTTGADVIAGLNALKFDGSATRMAIASAALAPGPSMTVFTVAKSTGSSTTRGVVSGDAGNGNTNRVFQHRWDSSSVPRCIGFNAAQNTSYQVAGSGQDWTKVFVMDHVFDSAGGTIHLYLNGTSMGTPTSGDSALTGASVQLTVGVATYSVTSGFWQGDICEIIIYNSALSTADRQSVESYLATKWQAIAALAGNAAGTGSASGASESVQPGAGEATGTAAAYQAVANVQPNAGEATGTGTANGAMDSNDASAIPATATGTAFGITAIVTLGAGVATGSGSAGDATVQTSSPTAQTHSGLIAPWVQPALRGPLYPTVGPIIVFALTTSQPRQSEHIDITNREDEEWLLLAA